MLKIIDDHNVIERYQLRFKRIIKHSSREVNNAFIGYMGGTLSPPDIDIVWNNRYSFWYAHFHANNRYWNAFGLENLFDNPHTSITCEINFPLNGINRRIAAAFVKNSDDNVYVVHRGNIGGGRKDIGKNLFINNYRGMFISVGDGGRFSEVALIGELNSNNFIKQIKYFILEVDRIKNLVKGDKIDNKFTPEFYGEKVYNISNKISAQCNHGIIVGELFNRLDKLGIKANNTRNCDLYIVGKSRNISKLFEIKTDYSLSDVYSAIGQLFYNSSFCNYKVDKIAVFPCGISEKIVINLDKLNIKVIEYVFNKEEIYFCNLENVI